MKQFSVLVEYHPHKHSKCCILVFRHVHDRWKGFNVSAQKLCSGDWERTLDITVWDWNRYVQ